MDVAEGCRHLREYKEEEGLDAYKTVHAWFATPVSAAARRFVSFVFNLNLALLRSRHLLVRLDHRLHKSKIPERTPAKLRRFWLQAKKGRPRRLHLRNTVI